MRWALLVVMLCGGCLESAVMLCDDGRTCGAGTSCDTTHHLCVSKQAQTACDGIADGMSCSFGDHAGMCSAGVCLEVFCGDGVKLGAEECDGTDLGAVVDCTGVGFYDPGAPGDVFCTPSCTINRDKCKRRCGDGIPDDEEQCDGIVLDDQGNEKNDCTQFGYYRSGPVTCNASCVPDLSQCEDKGYCGDGVLDPEENCDATPPLETCIDGGYDAGRMGCTNFCTPDFKGCKYIGWKSTIPGVQDSYNDILVTDASTLFIGTGNGFRKVVNKVANGVIGINQQSINAMWGTGTDMWLAGGLGFIGHYDGTSIMEKVAATSGNDSKTLYGIWGSSNTNLYAVGNFRVLHNTGGASWTEEVTDTTYYRGVWGTANGNHVYAVGSVGGSYMINHRPVSGVWQSEGPPTIGAQSLNSVWGVGNAPIAVGSPGLIVRGDGIGNWSTEDYDLPAAVNLNKVWGRGANDMFVVGSQGEVGYYDGTWWRLLTGIAFDLTSVHGFGTDVYAVGGDKLYKHANVSWSRPIAQTGNSIVAVSTTAADKTYVLSRDSLQVKTSAQFQGGVGPAIASGAPSFTSGIQASNMWVGGNAIAITSNQITGRSLPISSRVHRYNGTSWTTDTFPDAATGTELTSIAGTGTLLFAGAADGAIWRYNGSWAIESPSGNGRRVNAIWSDSSGIAYAVGRASTGGEVRRRDAAGTWTTITPPGAQELSTVWASSKDDVFVAGGPGPDNIYRYNATTNTWTPMKSPSPYDIKALSGTGPTDVFAVGNSIVLHYDGISWTELKIPSTLAGGYEAVSARAGLVLIGAGTNVFALVRTGPW